MPEPNNTGPPLRVIQCKVSEAQHLRFQELELELKRQKIIPSNGRSKDVVGYAIDFTLDYLRGKQTARTG